MCSAFYSWQRTQSSSSISLLVSFDYKTKQGENNGRRFAGGFFIFFLPLLSLIVGKYMSVLNVWDCFSFFPIPLILILLLIFSMKILICCNGTLQLKIIIYVGFHFSPYSFDFWFAFDSFNYFSMQILIYFNCVIQFKIFIYAIFHFCPYSFNCLTKFNCNCIY